MRNADFGNLTVEYLALGNVAFGNIAIGQVSFGHLAFGNFSSRKDSIRKLCYRECSLRKLSGWNHGYGASCFKKCCLRNFVLARLERGIRRDHGETGRALMREQGKVRRSGSSTL